MELSSQLGSRWPRRSSATARPAVLATSGFSGAFAPGLLVLFFAIVLGGRAGESTPDCDGPGGAQSVLLSLQFFLLLAPLPRPTDSDLETHGRRFLDPWRVR